MNEYPEYEDIPLSEEEAEAEARRRRRKRIVVAVSVVAGLWICGEVGTEIAVRTNPFPTEKIAVFRHSSEWFSADGERLGCALDAGGRFSPKRDLDKISPWLVKATIAAEDRRFLEHNGVDRLRVVRAAYDNLLAGRRVSGASTLTMQLCRLLEPRARNWKVKLDETWQAMRLSRVLSKEAQLELYLNNAPYGGNRVGVEAACRSYFGKSSQNLTIAEAALIAGLPQSPERLRPDRYPESAQKRRSRVLTAMAETGVITAEQRESAEREPLGLRASAEAPIAPHLLRLAAKSRPEGGILCLDAGLQREVSRVVCDAIASRDAALQTAAIVLDLKTVATLAWVGASPGRPAAQVDHARRLRSPGSTPKTFVYASAFEDRRIAPDTTLSDADLDRFTWAPRNFDRRERGDISAEDALRESLNLPAIALARTLGLARVAATADACGVRFRGGFERAGLSWVVGGAETTLAFLVSGYATIGAGGLTVPVRTFVDEPVTPGVRALEKRTCEALDHCLGVSDAHVPAGWETLDETRRPWFMWKTGTSSGGRDAWAIGHNGRYAIGVWVGTTRGKVREKALSRTHTEPVLAALFSLPRLRVDNSRFAHLGPWWPLVKKAAVATPPRILAPAPGSELLAPDGVALIYPKTDRVAEGAWFLDNSPVPPESLRPLRVPVGVHELRFVTTEGEASAVKFTVGNPE